MAYFPKALMPNFLKRDVAGTGTITAADFNRHTQAILDIENFLGISDASEQDVLDILAGKIAPKNFLGAVRYLADAMNVMVDGGVISTSGYVNSGQRMIFPQNVQTTFLSSPPATSDSSINVVSTAGFPNSGVISILNDIPAGGATIPDTTNVEWIRYSSKNGTAFLNCERAILSTTAGSHVGSPPPGQSLAGATDQRDQCVSLPVNLQVCNRRYQGWRLKTTLTFPAFNLIGTDVEMIKAIRRNPGFFSLDPATLKTSFAAITAAAQSAGILATASSGDYVLQSSDPSSLALGQLTWTEAASFVSSLRTSQVVTIMNAPADWITGPSPFAPVFQGALAVSHTIAGITINGSSNGTATPSRLKSVGIEQTADGRIVVVSTTNVDQRDAIEAVVQYRTFFVGSGVTSLQRNSL